MVRRDRDGAPGAAKSILNPSEPDPQLRYEYDRDSNYERDTRVTIALSALVPGDELHHPDHRFFQLIHLITEYSWVGVHDCFVTAAHELSAGNTLRASRAVDRGIGISRMPVDAVRLFQSSLPAMSFLAMRAAFPPNTTGLDSPGMRNLRRSAKSVWNCVESALNDRSVETILGDTFGESDSEDIELAHFLSKLYELDALLLSWKETHLHMVMMIIGGMETPFGQASSTVSMRGADLSDLKRLGSRPFFPQLWQASNTLFRQHVGHSGAS
ncbi:hypothetical protein [Rathayibacter tritici]|uniref:Tryptophan 2,3-dioxygenase n=1 Tax=Rathayibacter tritici TaxID=33888 RepID=A0A161IYJ1_9MICO|nr:hypothetical protein [Rathayibacter tritici]AND15261.1 hypothetical protein A6122_0092 [Rathayibacter tritici]